MANKIFLLGLFLLSVANVKAQTRTKRIRSQWRQCCTIFQK